MLIFRGEKLHQIFPCAISNVTDLLKTDVSRHAQFSQCHTDGGEGARLLNVGFSLLNEHHYPKKISSTGISNRNTLCDLRNKSCYITQINFVLQSVTCGLSDFPFIVNRKFLSFQLRISSPYTCVDNKYTEYIYIESQFKIQEWIITERYALV